MEFFGVELVGFHAENGRKLLLTLLAIALLWGTGKALVLLSRVVLRQHGRAFFWARQGVRGQTSTWTIASRWAACAAT